MKNILFKISIILSALSCSDNPSSGNLNIKEQYIAFVLTKDNIENTYEITDTSPIMGGTFFSIDNVSYTSISLTNIADDEPDHLSITFPGKNSGRYEWVPFSYNLIQIVVDIEEPLPLYRLIQGYTDVTKYGSVGGRIEGKLSGTIVKIIRNDISTRDTLSINGEFSVNRAKDYMP